MRGKEREAQTGIIIKQRFEKHTLVEAQPKTGRTHQIRVHLQYLNYPIIADRIYAGKRYDANDPATTLGFTRQALHASSITLMLPSEKEITIESPLPQDFVDAIKKIS
jgi:23S rRNA pseudouridine1911/1915/1917 synthase